MNEAPLLISKVKNSSKILLVLGVFLCLVIAASTCAKIFISTGIHTIELLTFLGFIGFGLAGVFQLCCPIQFHFFKNKIIKKRGWFEKIYLREEIQGYHLGRFNTKYRKGESLTIKTIKGSFSINADTHTEFEAVKKWVRQQFKGVKIHDNDNFQLLGNSWFKIICGFAALLFFGGFISKIGEEWLNNVLAVLGIVCVAIVFTKSG